MVPMQLLRQGGLFAVIKPKCVTSANVVDQLKPIIFGSDNRAGLRPRPKVRVKIGHGGTLDKNASGVLVIGLGQGTKSLKQMLQGKKKYSVIGCLGSGTDTMDAGGKVTEAAPYDHIKQEDIEKVLQLFRGSILQVPPVYSALKVGGKRMSDLVMEGHDVEPKPARPVMVYHLSCTAFDSPYFHLDVTCGGGFYVRSLVSDVGKAVGSCAHVKELCRTQQGPFTLNQALKECDWTFDNITKALIDPRKLVEEIR
ncbi:pseudouridylate synthase TRUB1-like [Amphiura filiformis]|uniref:pseudouridylate synthase TRUB1-like n=1 Tax=Amphiura filiformis TaxID=82378 RepID=UPI003B2267B8